MPTPESTMNSNPDTEEMSGFTEEGAEKAITRLKRHKVHEMNGITSGVINLGGQGIIYIPDIFNNILTNDIPNTWHEAKIAILFKKNSNSVH